LSHLSLRPSNLHLVKVAEHCPSRRQWDLNGSTERRRSLQERDGTESGDVVWVPPPPEGTAVNFDVVYVIERMPVTDHPGRDSMGTELVGMVELENRERVYVTWLVREMGAPLRENIERLRSVRVFDAEGRPVERTGMLGFGTEPNPDAAEETEICTIIDVTRPDEVETPREERRGP
jgi:hypothetical protein